MNVINDKWLFVTYLDGHSEQISVRQAFIDADKIKSLDTPTFHNKKAYLYDVPVMQFLSVLLLSAYFKPETDFEASGKYFSQKLMKKGWNKKIILDYLDKWAYKFDVFDEQFPFLQDTTLKESADKYAKKDKKNTYILNINPLAPGAANNIFENNPTKDTSVIENFAMDNTELVYALLYHNSMGMTICPGTYCGQALLNSIRMFILLQGNNLKETIIYNTLPLRNSTKPDEYSTEALYDKPIWEFDNPDDIMQYGEKLGNNHLACSFFPSQPIYIKAEDGKIVGGVFGDKTEHCVIDKDSRLLLERVYFEENPYAVKNVNPKDNTLTKYNWTKDLKVSGLCTEITKKTDFSLCNIISDTQQYNHDAKCFIYYRDIVFKSSINILCGFGKYDEIPQHVFDLLQSPNYNKIAEIYQIAVDRYRYYMTKLADTKEVKNVAKFKVDEMTSKFSQSAEVYFLQTLVKECDTCTEEEIINNFLKFLYKTAITLINGVVNTPYVTSPINYAKSVREYNGRTKKVNTKCLSLWEEFANG